MIVERLHYQQLQWRLCDGCLITITSPPSPRYRYRYRYLVHRHLVNRYLATVLAAGASLLGRRVLRGGPPPLRLDQPAAAAAAAAAAHLRRRVNRRGAEAALRSPSGRGWRVRVAATPPSEAHAALLGPNGCRALQRNGCNGCRALAFSISAVAVRRRRVEGNGGRGLRRRDPLAALGARARPRCADAGRGLRGASPHPRGPSEGVAAARAGGCAQPLDAAAPTGACAAAGGEASPELWLSTAATAAPARAPCHRRCDSRCHSCCSSPSHARVSQLSSKRESSPPTLTLRTPACRSSPPKCSPASSTASSRLSRSLHRASARASRRSTSSAAAARRAGPRSRRSSSRW